MLDDQAEYERATGYIELLATYINPEVMTKVFEQRKAVAGVEKPWVDAPSEDRGVAPNRVVNLAGIQFAQTNFEFADKMRELKDTGVVEPKPDNPNIPRLRAKLKAEGKNIYSMEDYYRRQGIDADAEILPDGSN